MGDSKTSCPAPESKSRNHCLVLPSTALGQTHSLLRNLSPLRLWPETQDNSSALLSLPCRPKLPPLPSLSFLILKEGDKDLVGPQMSAQMCAIYSKKLASSVSVEEGTGLISNYITAFRERKKRHEKTKWMRVRWKDDYC